MSARVLEATGTAVRHVKVDSVERLGEVRGALRALIESAAKLNG